MEKTLTELQSEVKKDPELYKGPVQNLIEEYTKLFTVFPETPSSPNARLGELVSFLSQISAYFLTELKHFPSQLLSILNNYYSALDAEFRIIVFQGLMLLRNREQIPAMSILPICFKLFRCQDKELRLLAFNFLIKDIKKINKHTQNYQINKQLQGFIYEMIEDSNVTAAKKSLHVLMTLYKKRIWIDARTINVIANACLLKEPKLVMIGCTFLLIADSEDFALDSDNSDEECPEKHIIGAKKTKGRLNQKERQVKSYEKKQRRKEKKTDSKEPNFLTIDQLNDPQGFVEKLLFSLKKVFNKGKHELQVKMLQVVARIVGRHKLMLLEVYPFIQKFVTPKSKNSTQMLIICAEATHELVPPQELAPVVKKVLDNFLSEHCSEEFLVRGLNCIREICKRQPLIMTKELLEHINTFKTYKNKSVMSATAGLINLYKEIRPSLLKNKLKDGEMDQVGEYGEVKVYTRVPGAELLEEKNKEIAMGNQQVRILQPQQKSDNLIRLEEVLQKREAKSSEGKKKKKLEEDDDEDDDNEEGNDEEVDDDDDDDEDDDEDDDDDDDEDDEDDENADDEEEEEEDEKNYEEEADDDENIDEKDSDEEDLNQVQEEDSEDLDKDEDNECVKAMPDEDKECVKAKPEVVNRKKAKNDSNESINGSEEAPVFYESSTIPYECDRILTQNDFNRIKQLKREAEARRRRMDVCLLSDSDSDSKSLISDSDLETMQISKQEKLRLGAQEKNDHKRHRKEKKGGKTNRQHAKSKPAMMVIGKKKDSLRKKFEVVKKKIRRSKQQLGKFSKRFSATKRQL